MLEGIFLIILIAGPCVVIALSLLVSNLKLIEGANLIASITGFAITIGLVIEALSGPYYYLNRYVMIDGLSGWVLLCTSTVYLLASIYSMGYMRYYKDEKRLRFYYALFSGFALTMLLGAIMNNLALYWVCIDLTTVVSTFLVCFKRSEESVEASWKYLVIVIAGLSIALLGILLLSWGGKSVMGNQFELTWNSIKLAAPKMEHHFLILIYILLLIGFGTKVGLAPMHTWLPDAHSEGPAPASAMLSGALLNTAMLSLVRFIHIMKYAKHGFIAHTLLVILGIISLIIAAFFIAKQRGVKRLMAYSSLEHMGIVGLGFGFGGLFGFAGAMYHMINHSLNKSLMFFGCGNAMHAYGSKNMEDMRGILKVFPRSGLMWLLGALAITGAPPGGLFLSELSIMRGGMASQNMWAVYVMLALLIIIFCGFMMHFFRMYYSKADIKIVENPPRMSYWYFIPMFLAVVPLFVFGVWWPQGFWHYFTATAHLYGVA